MREERPSPKERMGFLSRELLKPLEERLVNTAGAELDDQLVVVNRELLAVRRHGALYVPRRHDLVVSRRQVRRLDCWRAR